MPISIRRKRAPRSASDPKLEELKRLDRAILAASRSKMVESWLLAIDERNTYARTLRTHCPQ